MADGELQSVDLRVDGNGTEALQQLHAVAGDHHGYCGRLAGLRRLVPLRIPIHHQLLLALVNAAAVFAACSLGHRLSPSRHRQSKTRDSTKVSTSVRRRSNVNSFSSN